jgi:hypothetical protein
MCLCVCVCINLFLWYGCRHIETCKGEGEKASERARERESERASERASERELRFCGGGIVEYGEVVVCYCRHTHAFSIV